MNINLPSQQRAADSHPRGIRLTPQQLARFKQAFYNNQGDDEDDPFERAFLTLSVDEVGTGSGYTSEDLSAAMDEALKIMSRQKVG